MKKTPFEHYFRCKFNFSTFNSVNAVTIKTRVISLSVPSLPKCNVQSIFSLHTFNYSYYLENKVTLPYSLCERVFSFRISFCFSVVSSTFISIYIFVKAPNTYNALLSGKMRAVASSFSDVATCVRPAWA